MKTSRVLLPSRGPSLASDFGRLIKTYPAAAFIGACVIVTNILIAPYRFADYPQYLLITDGLYYFSAGRWLDFEVASNIVLLGSRIATGNTIRSVNLVHYLLGAAYIYFVFHLAHRNEVGWRGLLISFGLYGALLAFVTIRATPAYMLVTLAALDITKNRNRAVVLVLLASLFHVSALLALGPVIAGLLQSRLPGLRWMETSTKAFLAMIVGLAAAFGLLYSVFSNAVSTLVTSIPFLNKYDVYTASLDPLNSGQDSGISSNHLLYAVLMSVLAVGFMAMPDERCRKLRLYVLTSYAMFLMLEFAPVTAYRQSQFWAIPAMLLFPWHRLAPGGVRAIGFAVACVGLFLFSVRGVYY